MAKVLAKDQKKDVIANLNDGDNVDLVVVEVKAEEKNVVLMLDETNVDD